MAQWKNDTELFKLIRQELFTAVVGDILDVMGLRRQFLPPQIQPMRDKMVLIGRVMTVHEADCDEETSAAPDKPKPPQPFGLMLEALDDLKLNEVYFCSGSSPSYALWGELMSVRAMRCGAAGAVVNGYHRDTNGILDLGFPVFSYGAYAQDQAQRGKVVDFRCGLEIDGVRVSDGDIIFGDVDGVLIIPRDAEEEALTRAIEKARGEKTVRKAIESGMTAADAFKHYGIM